ncbi:uncharacterized protein EI97DRAFT_429607 [Westerdykella ornata]|uniref:Uncharacterized protein n=1 Tax=Westerdykella ornata TaxID=318751 RepID=A0A6A6JZE2_WESOR|nr:uncharacterized protein EI97DRAFT_429607 [Westerdykella ornata]KAF2281604.1 hypothetical protein EI97DRAFT_429607 [Westerdykella ornata]
MASPVTILINTLDGKTLAFPSAKDAPISEIHSTLSSRLEWTHSSPYILTTTNRRIVSSWSTAPTSTLLSSESDTFLPLRLTVPLCGGKGGFGSILRAQGGRMSSRKKQGEQNGSSRNLDGRRLRTVAEAKALAEYLASKPEMERKEREEKRKRWEDIVASTERKQEELRSGRGRLDAGFLEGKEEAEQKTREAIEAMLRAEGRGSSEEGEASDEQASGSSSSKPAVAPRAMYGWEDEDDEFMSDSEEEEEVSEEDVKPAYEGKGKGKAV